MNNKESGETRMERDKKDILTMVSFLQERNPFEINPALRNIETGVTTDTRVNIDDAKAVGQALIDSMVVESILKFSFKRSKQVVLMNTRNSIKIDDEHVQIDPQLLFQDWLQQLTTWGKILLQFSRMN